MNAGQKKGLKRQRAECEAAKAFVISLMDGHPEVSLKLFRFLMAEGFCQNPAPSSAAPTSKSMTEASPASSAKSVAKASEADCAMDGNGWLRSRYEMVQDLSCKKLISMLVHMNGNMFSKKALQTSKKEHLLMLVEFTAGIGRDMKLSGALRHWEHLLTIGSFMHKQRGCRSKDLCPSATSMDNSSGVYELLRSKMLRHRFTGETAPLTHASSSMPVPVLEDLILQHNHSEENAVVVLRMSGTTVVRCMDLLPNQIVDRELKTPLPSKPITEALLRERLRVSRRKMSMPESPATSERSGEILSEASSPGSTPLKDLQGESEWSSSGSPSSSQPGTEHDNASEAIQGESEWFDDGDEIPQSPS